MEEIQSQWLNYVKATVKKRLTSCNLPRVNRRGCLRDIQYDEFAEEADKADPDKLIDVFEKHCIGEVDEVYERYVFHRRQQELCESLDVFLSDLRRLVKSCDYSNVEQSTIRDRIVIGIGHDATRKKLLQTRKLDLSKAIDICRSAESTTR